MTTALRALVYFVEVQWLLAATWLMAAKIFGRPYPGGVFTQVMRWWWAELRPFYLPAAVAMTTFAVVRGELHGFWDFFGQALAIVNWWLCRNLDDDRWKRRKAKLVARVERRGARLVAVPVRSS